MKHIPAFCIKLFFCGMFLFVGSCKESLPPRDNPGDLFKGEIKGEYQLSPTENALNAIITIKNFSDETLEDSALFTGSITLESQRNIAWRKTIQISEANYLVGGSYNHTTKTLTINPGDSIMLGYAWDWFGDNGKDFRTRFFKMHWDRTCYHPEAIVRRIAYRETFLIRGDVKIFKHTNPIVLGPVPYSFCYVSQWFPPTICPLPQCTQ